VRETGLSGFSDRTVTDLEHEQSYVSHLYERLDAMREQAARRLHQALREGGGTPQARTERDITAAMYTQTLAELDGVEQGLCFGRLDFHDDTHDRTGPRRTYLGRIGIFAEDGDLEPLLLDWRAPAARPFYLATAASPLGVDRRRHIRTRGRTVTGLDDEVLDLASAATSGHTELTSESALLAAVSASRTGRMRDIVATIQAEQDQIIRSDLGGVLVVQGGPGTGKTAVALHRAAYLLYTHRQLLATRGVLILGPNETFLRYISQVLPSLAETGVLLRTLGDLYPGVRATREESPAGAELKGRATMVDVLARAVADRQLVPIEPMRVDLADDTLVLEPATVEYARARARRTGQRHNDARNVFARLITEALGQQVAEKIGTDPYADDPLGGDDAPGDPMLLGAADLADIRADLAGEPAVQEAIESLWPTLTPERLLADLYADPALLLTATPDLTEAERGLLGRQPDGTWTPADVPLLDEAVELLGFDEEAELRRLEAALREQEDYAQGALDIVAGSRPLDLEDEQDPEILLATDLLDARRLAERQALREQLTTAQRAALDRNWAFGHIIVDEAQELSPMAWRLLMRRSPSRSMTVVGDVAQTGDLAGTSSWDRVFSPYVAQRWRLTELTVNYRTPAEIMDRAATLLARIDPSLTPPSSVRATGVAPRGLVAPLDELPDVVKHESTALDEGTVGVIVADTWLTRVRELLPESGVDTQVCVLTVRQAKGLEFDAVIVVDPEAIVTATPRGRSDLYVAMTRATQRLALLAPQTPSDPDIVALLDG
jgi:DNA helicase IV